MWTWLLSSLDRHAELLTAVACLIEAVALVKLWRLESKQEADRKNVEVFVELVLNQSGATNTAKDQLVARVANLSAVGIWMRAIEIRAADIKGGLEQVKPLPINRVMQAYADESFPCHGEVWLAAAAGKPANQPLPPDGRMGRTIASCFLWAQVNFRAHGEDRKTPSRLYRAELTSTEVLQLDSDPELSG